MQPLLTPEGTRPVPGRNTWPADRLPAEETGFHEESTAIPYSESARILVRNLQLELVRAEDGMAIPACLLCRRWEEAIGISPGIFPRRSAIGGCGGQPRMASAEWNVAHSPRRGAQG